MPSSVRRVDSKNRDKGPRGVAVVPSSYEGLKKGQVLVCNFANSSGGAGKGTTVEKLDPNPGSKPATFVQNGKIEGCSGDSISSANDDLYVSRIYQQGRCTVVAGGRLGQTWGKPLVAPFSIVDAACTRSIALPLRRRAAFYKRCKDRWHREFQRQQFR